MRAPPGKCVGVGVGAWSSGVVRALLAACLVQGFIGGCVGLGDDGFPGLEKSPKCAVWPSKEWDVQKG